MKQLIFGLVILLLVGSFSGCAYVMNFEEETQVESLPAEQTQETELFQSPVYDANLDDDTRLSLELGIDALYGRGDSGFDKAKAETYLTQAALKGSGEAFYQLGILYERSSDPNRFNKAEEYYREAVNQGYLPGLVEIGNLYLEGKGREPDFEKAASLFQDAVDQGCVEGYWGFGMLCLKGYGADVSGMKAEECFLIALNSTGYSWINRTCIALGTLYLNGSSEVSKNYELAREYFELAAHNGYGSGFQNLGFMLENGLGTDQNLGKAMEYYKVAAYHGVAFSNYCLGIQYYKGNGVAANMEAAKIWFGNGAVLGDGACCEMLGQMYFKGAGEVLKDTAMAVDYFRQGACGGSAYSMYALGYFYETGTGVSQNLLTAEEWFGKALMYASGREEYVKQKVQKELSWLVETGQMSQYMAVNLIQKSIP